LFHTTCFILLQNLTITKYMLYWAVIMFFSCAYMVYKFYLWWWRFANKNNIEFSELRSICVSWSIQESISHQEVIKLTSTDHNKIANMFPKCHFLEICLAWYDYESNKSSSTRVKEQNRFGHPQKYSNQTPYVYYTADMADKNFDISDGNSDNSVCMVKWCLLLVILNI